ncbi:MAG: hypothetical protein U1F54_14690 [Burkholderiales bacterium]
MRPLAAMAATLAFALAAHAAPVSVHGSGDAFGTPGAKLAWAIARGADEASTFVVVRVAADRAKYPWLAVVGVDPFSKAETTRVPPAALQGPIDVRMARASIADHPNTEFRFFASEQDARAGTAALVVYYHGVPDTAPEFADAQKLSQYLTDRLTRLP